jgi:hypothetical protein
MPRTIQDASRWFHAAARCYVERHQGCAWCGGSYRVFEIRRDSTLEYFCNACDFRAGHDEADDHYFCVPGAKNTGAPPTMHGLSAPSPVHVSAPDS